MQRLCDYIHVSLSTKNYRKKFVVLAYVTKGEAHFVPQKIKKSENKDINLAKFYGVVRKALHLGFHFTV